jgi:putative SOS response-associated peptidase YedK
MCGRYSLTTTRHDLARELALPIEAVPVDIVPRWNIAPTQPVAALRSEGGLRLDLLQWGLVPEWARDPSTGNRPINARSETLAERPTFRDSFRDRRCLVVADGFYEWAPVAGARRGPKTPYFVRLRRGGVFTFAGLWSRWRGRGKDELLTCTIVTCPPNELVASVHDRMPVIVPEANRAAWLDPDHRDPDSLSALLRAYPAEQMEMYEVSRHVNSTAHDDPRCVERAAGRDDSSPGADAPRLFR